MRLSFAPAARYHLLRAHAPACAPPAADSTRHSTCGGPATVLPCAQYLLESLVHRLAVAPPWTKPTAHRLTLHWLPVPVSRRPKRLTSSSSSNVAQHDSIGRGTPACYLIQPWSRIAHAMQSSRKWLSGDGMRPGCPASSHTPRQSPPDRPWHSQDRGAMSPKHPRVSPRSSRGSITGPRQCSGPMCVVATWGINSSKIATPCWNTTSTNSTGTPGE